ncbi:hypothetical protein [Kaarinaea lacus]
MSSSDVFGGDNFEDIIAAVDSIEDTYDLSSPSELAVDITAESTLAQPYITDFSFENSAELDSSTEFTVEYRTEKLFDGFTSDDPDYEEPLNDFDGVAAANEIVNLFYDEQDTPDNASHAVFPKESGQIGNQLTALCEMTDHANQEPTTSPELLETPVTTLFGKPTGESGTRKISLYGFSQRFPALYLGLASLMVVVGFVYIMLFPALFTLVTLNAFEMLNNPFTQNSLPMFVSFFSISLFLFLISFKLFDLKFIIPEGITLDENNASELMKKLQTLRNQRRIPKIHQVVLTRRHELNVIKIPRFGIPIWSRNVLAIGYPLLQTLSTEYFDCALSRRLLQYSKRRNLIINWLSFMRQIWTLYATSLKERNGVSDLIHYCFFAPYSSLYRRFAVYIRQTDELLADEFALEIVNDRDLIKSAQTLRLTQAMLIQYYWPKLNDAIQNNFSSPANIRPYFNLPGTLASLLNSEDVDAWFIRLAQERETMGSAEAPFAKRMAQMGHRKVSTPKPFDTTAANHYFGDQYEAMTDHMDELWAEEVQKTLFLENLEKGEHQTILPFSLSIQTA